MDIATLAGMLGAFGLILWSMLQGGTVAAYLNVPGIAIVLGGSIMVVLLRSSLEEFANAIKVAGKAFGKGLEKPDELISQMVEFATIARKDGMIALEGQEINNQFLEKAIGMLVDGVEEDVVTKTLNQDIDSMRLRHKQGAAVFSSWGEVAPAMGMIGTLIGLIQMLGNMDDPKSIGPAMAVALLTTMYGAIIANVFCIPISQKLTNRSEIEAANCALIVEGILFIQKGGNARILTDLLISFVPPKERKRLVAA
ncbi:MotA/TolQ/ExbB proton channel family protein [Gammaproteobacteria bacterium]|jgi:chemotaxis protein MotA|nr:MotA/TolQ/ExbB proton channel family protein [Gammaproteobacteria bacterium]|tara:strand:- start:1222 stop:1983 length:762 start_codon:yes stop_codon:yes gene_type:complete